MRTSELIVEKLDRWLAWPGWVYFTGWCFPPIARPRPLPPRPDYGGPAEAASRRFAHQVRG
jgi:hypothetical protein